MNDLTRRATVAAALCLSAGCDPLVGGECAAGLAPVDQVCVPVETVAASGGQGGSGATTAGGAGGSVLGTGGAGASEGGADACPSPLAVCDGACVDLGTSPLHCGACGHACPTEVCVEGSCTGEPVGHAIVLGVDYRQVALASPSAVLLGNAVFMTAHDPVRLVDYRKHASALATARVDAILAAEAAARGRGLVIEHLADADALASCVANSTCDAVLVHHQTVLSGLASSPGGAWAAPLAALVDAGGVAVVLASATGSKSATAAFVDALGLVPATAITPVGGQLVYHEGWLDVLGQGVLAPFLAPPGSGSFVTDAEPGATLSFVLRSASGEPIAIHRAYP
ncbi:MAG: hypothetical protein HY908_37565 [Myxococcales bacterium]|nr:hypothetical protein [Myxococcales bacterium]